MCSEGLRKLSKEYLNALTGKFYAFLDKIMKLLTYRMPFSH